jgi:hypothetical protein
MDLKIIGSLFFGCACVSLAFALLSNAYADDWFVEPSHTLAWRFAVLWLLAGIADRITSNRPPA